MPPARTEFNAGLRAGLSLLVAVAPFGLVTGVAMAASGIPPLEAMAMSVRVYAGASMLAAAQLIAEGAPALVVVFAAFIVNLRHVMYSAALRPHFAGDTLFRRIVVSYLLVDNVFAMVLARFDNRPQAEGKFAYVLGNSIPVWICWQTTVALGLLVGNQLPAAWKLEFAAPLAFIAMSIPLLRDKPMVAAAVSAGITVVALHALPLKLGLALAATVGIVIGVWFEGLLKVKAK